jgi:SagB-type dehydrogenase family enzyme
MAKLLLVAAPLALYAIAWLLRAATGRRPTRHALNVELAILLTLYFLVTAGLGIFWVANQQLPPFDLHYLFGYATAALVAAHLALNLHLVVAYVRRKVAGSRPAASSDARKPWAGSVGKLLAITALAGVVFLLGMRAGTTELPPIPAGSADAHLAAIERYHEMSTHTREGVLTRAPSVAWDLPVAPTIDRSTARRIDLPAPEPERGPPRAMVAALTSAPAARGTPFDRRDLSQLLWATAGITDRRGGLALRASASSGALFPTEVYVIAFDVEGLPAGVYAFGPDDHALFELGGAPRPDSVLGLSWRSPPTLALVFTSVFRRSGQKYRDRAYRYAVADAGHAVGQAMVAAGELGLASALAPRFDDAAVAALVGADGEAEGAMAVLALAPGPPGALPLDGRPHLEPGGAALAPLALRDPEGLELGATAWAHIASSLGGVDDATPAAGDTIPLPPVAERSRSTFALVASRRSVRSFDRAPLPLESVAAAMQLATSAPPVISGAVRVHLVASRVDALAPGVYRHRAAEHALAGARRSDLAAEVGRAALDQEVVADAPAVVVLTLDRSALAAEGARGYRHAFLEAGILGARLYLAAAAADLGGCAVGAFYDAELAATIGVDLQREWPLHLFALGAPASTR